MKLTKLQLSCFLSITYYIVHGGLVGKQVSKATSRAFKTADFLQAPVLFLPSPAIIRRHLMDRLLSL